MFTQPEHHIISLDDLRDELNVPSGVTVNDDELRLYIAATTAVIEDIVGTVLAQTQTESFDGGKAAVLLSERAASITSVTVDGARLLTDTVGGIVTRELVAPVDVLVHQG